MSIMLQTPLVIGPDSIETSQLADGAVTADKIADGAVGPQHLSQAFTRVTLPVNTNLDGHTAINAGQRLVLRFPLHGHRGTALVTTDWPSYTGQHLIGALIGGLTFMTARDVNSSNAPVLTMIVFEDYTKAIRGTNRGNAMESGGVYGGQTYADGNGLLFGWYTIDNGGPFSTPNSKAQIESAWLTENELHIAIKSAAASGSCSLNGTIWVVC